MNGDGTSRVHNWFLSAMVGFVIFLLGVVGAGGVTLGTQAQRIKTCEDNGHVIAGRLDRIETGVATNGERIAELTGYVRREIGK